jgi:outer membrane immunogenic protein
VKKSFLAIAVIATAIVAPAHAADMPLKAAPPPVSTYNWTGFYIGGDGGFASAQSAGTFTNAAGFFPVPYNFNASGGFAGGFVGAQKQWQNLVVGIEADLQGASLKGNSGALTLLAPSVYTVATNVTTYGSVRARIGFAADRWLLFATAGWAEGHFSTSYTGSAPIITNSATQPGWTAGAGVNYAVLNNLFLTLEYRNTSLNASSFTAGSATVLPNAAETGNTIKINDVRGGIGVKF